MNFKTKLLGIWLGASLLVGLLLRPLVPEGADRDSEGQTLASLSGGLGQGITFAALGGYRSVAANFVWISMYGDWRYRMEAEVLEKMELAVALNPDSLYFWIDGSRIIANDMPVWQVGEASMGTLFDSEEGIAIRREYGEQALRFLDAAPDRLAGQVPMIVEKGAICWQRLGDLERALVYFNEAVSDEAVPNYVCRVYAELLAKNGQLSQACEYLEKHYEGLSDDDVTAMKPFVASRILEMRRLLGRE